MSPPAMARTGSVEDALTKLSDQLSRDIDDLEELPDGGSSSQDIAASDWEEVHALLRVEGEGPSAGAPLTDP